MARQVTSLVMLFTPVIVLNALRFIVDPLGDMMAVSTNLDIGLHIGSVWSRVSSIQKDKSCSRP